MENFNIERRYLKLCYDFRTFIRCMKGAFYRPDFQKFLMCNGHKRIERSGRAFILKHAAEFLKNLAELLKNSAKLLKHPAEPFKHSAKLLKV